MSKRAYERVGERSFRLNTEARVSVTVLLDGYVSIGGMCHISMEDFLAMGKVANALAKEQPQ
jgi:hypothetical protein